MAADYIEAWKLLYGWQTLITGLLALFAATVAARPGWKQLKILEVQTGVLARDALDARLAAIRAREKGVHRNLVLLTDKLMQDLFPLDDEREPDISPDWAFDAQQAVRAAIDDLVLQQETSFDGELIDVARDAVIRKAGALLEYLATIHLPFSRDLDLPPWNYSMTQIAEARAVGKLAEGRLTHCLAAVSAARRSLEGAFAAGLERLRSRIRHLDALVAMQAPEPQGSVSP